ncbi:MAG: hypothetical protein U0521_23165 [Anaerolineae bacterium]
MTARNLFIVNSIVAIVFGLAFILIPDPVLKLYAVELNAQGLFVSQLFGAALVGFALITWLLRDVDDVGIKQSVMLALFVSDAIGFVLSLIAQLNSLANALGWSTVVIYLLLALGFGYFRFLQRGTSSAG